MDACHPFLYFSNMTVIPAIPSYGLYGEEQSLPDLLHCETIGARAQPLDWQIKPHRHNALHQIFLFRKGGGVITCEGVRTRITDDLLISMPARVVHGFSFQRDTVGFVLTLPVSHFATHDLDRPLRFKASPDFEQVFELIARQHSTRVPGREAVLQGLADTLLALVRQDQSSEALRRDLPSQLVAFDAAISDMTSPMRNVADFARDLGVSPTHLTRLCQQYWGKPASGIIEARRMDEARRQLVYTRLPIASIAETVGYLDPAYFSRAFKRCTGASPNTYRAQFSTL